MKKISFYFMSMFLLLGGRSAYAGLANGMANIVLGQPDFATTAAGNGMANLTDPHFVVVDAQSGKVYVVDTGNDRVLQWASIDTLSNGKAADGVIGQGTLSGPTSLALDGSGNLWVADAGDNRVLRFPAISNFSAPDLVIGQADMSGINNGLAANRLNAPRSISVDAGGNLWVVDTKNHRVLRFSPPFSSGMDANLVLGQSNFTDNTELASSGSPSAGSFWAPQTVFSDRSGNIWVADHLDHRFLRFSPPFTNGMNANLVLGQADFVHGSQNPTGHPAVNSIFCAYGITMDANGNVWVADFSNNRVLRYSGALTNGMNAAQVIGQADFAVELMNRGGTAAADTLYHPCAVSIDHQGNLWVCEGGNEGSHAGSNNRVLKFNALRGVSLDITSCSNVGPRRITINGQGIVAGTRAKLVRAGQRDITATAVTIPADETSLAGTFNLSGVQPGAWDLVLEGGGMNARLANALTVTTIGIASITPNSAINTGPVNVVIAGDHIEEGATVKLMRQKYGEIRATNVTLSSSQVQCTFDITDARTGKWSVVIASGAAVATLADAFAVHFPSYTVRFIQRTRSYYIGIETAQGEAAFEIPSYTFAQDLTMSISDPDVLPPVTQQEFMACDFAANVVCSPDLQPDKRMTVTATCADALLEGHNRNKMVMTYFDAPLSRWIQMSSRAIPGENAVASMANHVSLYRLLERVPAGDLSNVLVYPNPFKPGSGTGYDEPSLGGGVAFAGLTGNVTLKIFNVAGELVRQIDQQDGTGVVLWDTKTEQGDKAASGVYLYLISSQDTGEKKKGKFSIIR